MFLKSPRLLGLVLNLFSVHDEESSFFSLLKPSLLCSFLCSVLLLGVSSCSLSEVGNSIQSPRHVQGSNYLVEKSIGAYDYTKEVIGLGDDEPVDPSILYLKGKKGPGQGKTVVLISGDEEYRTEESMPMLAKILAERHGFTCKVLFSWDEGGNYIDPDNHRGVKGWHHLDKADLMIIGTRFRDPSTEDAKYITRFLNDGKPVIGIRTSTHAFKWLDDRSFGGKITFKEFGPKGDGRRLG